MNLISRSPILPGNLVYAAGSCASTLDEPPDKQEILQESLPESTAIPAAWVAPQGDTGNVDDGWIKTFNDPQLEMLVAEAIDKQNPNMLLLSAQVDRAEALARLGNAALQPTVALGGDLSETTGGAGTSSSIGVGVSWEADVWGRVKAGANAADESYRASVADFEFARQSLAVGVAKSWYLATELQQQAQRALEILLGRYPAAEIQTAQELVSVPPPVPSGLPVDLLERRPDLVASERRVAAAFFLTEEARLAKLPSFTLNATVGSSNAVDNLIGNLGAGFVAPLFTGGALEAQLDAATADQNTAMAAYALVVLDALGEVETGLSEERLLTDREQFLAAAVANNEPAWLLAKKRYKVGEIDLLSVLQIQSRWVGARIALLHVRNQHLAQRIDLHLALGGSFERNDR
jgi:multidrug efflux system outer membrane protein